MKVGTVLFWVDLTALYHPHTHCCACAMCFGLSMFILPTPPHPTLSHPIIPHIMHAYIHKYSFALAILDEIWLLAVCSPTALQPHLIFVSEAIILFFFLPKLTEPS